ncbi:pyruvate dehydrogenase complex dihydrolipoamide acetyltransferase [Croceicoccus pelagius]|uniref:Acetyltransferase component of pyruvate dehydrogenase complex n=1 Tax=Croceicoccus pelagius TaxID=1703341 RepID=A0A916YD51_9SPHN|nr:pyruvate dehydrogenase complex dihydrolipoamide acetyltransferase [Croceicoccus pelagius]GGD40506.1 acetyltransferase component of pyruvate dehydrogenase complex [Croceicoccus pelagius]
MAIELKMPALSPTMEKGTLAKWLVSEGDTVKPGDMIAEIETDKATMEFEAVDEGVIVKLIVPEGTEDVAVGTVIASMAAEGEAVEVAAAAEPAKEPVAAEVSAPAPAVPAPVAAPAPAPAPAVQPTVQDTSVNATPLARRIAVIRDIALSSITGTGPNGKIVKADLGIPAITRAPDAAPVAAVAPQATIAPPPEGVPVETVKLSSMRKTIARRLSESKSTVPHFYLTARCNLDPLLALRKQLNETLSGQGLKLSVNDMLIKALAVALGQVPDANVQYGGDVLHHFDRVDVSMAVAIDGGLITPVIRDAGAKSLSAIANESKALAEKARDGRLTPEDYAGGTVSLSNLGMFGIDEMFPVINPPQALILGTAAGVSQPWNVDGEIKLATIMAATASFDHRAIDGAVAAQFMAAFKALVEQPFGLAV